MFKQQDKPNRLNKSVDHLQQLIQRYVPSSLLHMAATAYIALSSVQEITTKSFYLI